MCFRARKASSNLVRSFFSRFPMLDQCSHIRTARSIPFSLLRESNQGNSIENSSGWFITGPNSEHFYETMFPVWTKMDREDKDFPLLECRTHYGQANMKCEHYTFKGRRKLSNFCSSFPLKKSNPFSKKSFAIIFFSQRNGIETNNTIQALSDPSGLPLMNTFLRDLFLKKIKIKYSDGNKDNRQSRKSKCFWRNPAGGFLSLRKEVDW